MNIAELHMIRYLAKGQEFLLVQLGIVSIRHLVQIKLLGLLTELVFQFGQASELIRWQGYEAVFLHVSTR